MSSSRRRSLPQKLRQTASPMGMALLPGLVAILPILVYGAFVLTEWQRAPLLGGDQGLLELWTRSASEGDAYLGPYSRFRWNHPGPTVFYWFMPFYVLTGERPAGLGLACLALVIIGVFSVCWMTRAVAGRTAGWVSAGAFLLFWFTAGVDWFDDTWNPVVIVLPLIVLGVAAAAFASGKRGALPVAVAAATFCLQTHIGTLPVVGVFAAVAAVSLVVKLRESNAGWARPLLASVAVLAVLWAAPIYEQVTRSPGNVTQIVDSNTSQSGANHGLSDVAEIVSTPFTLSGRGLMGRELGRLGQGAPMASTGVQVAAGLLLLIGVLGAAFGYRRRNPFAAILCGGSAVGMLALVVALTRAQGELEGYLVLSAMSAGFLLYLGLALLSFQVLRDRFAGNGALRHGRRAFGALVVGGALLLCASVVTGDARDFVYSTRPSPAGAEQTMGALEEMLPPGPVLVKIDDPTVWPVATLLANQLERQGRSTAAEPDWIFMFGDQRTSTGCEVAAVRVGGDHSQETDGVEPAGDVEGVVVDVEVLEPAPGCS